MLSEQEKQGCSEILELLSTEDLLSLTNTATNRVVSTRNRKDATSAILQFTYSVEEFFRRRKINKDVLMKYIYLQGWHIPREKDLQDIQNFITHKWTRRSCQSNALRVKSERKVESPSLSHPNTERSVSFTQINNYNNNQYVRNNTVNYTVINVHLTTPQIVTQTSQSQDYESAVNFVKWFYSLLNSCIPDMGSRQREFGPQHFWVDAQMMLEITTKGSCMKETLNGAELVARKLLTFPVSERLFFYVSPSEDSIKIRSENGSKKVIMVCGKLKSQGASVGYFCQSFGLLADPVMLNSHKVKITLLKMNDVQTFQASLTQDKDASLMEGLTVSAIQGFQ